MSDHIPFEMQSEIMKRLPVRSLVQFRSVSKQWKSFIDCPEFIKTYHINHPNPYHHLLVLHRRGPTYTSIIDDNTFPKQKFHLTVPEPLNSLSHPFMLGSVEGLLCFVEDKIVVIWNPSVRKCVGIVIPDRLHSYTCLGFGVCPDTRDPKLVKINVRQSPSISSWEVQVFTLSSRVWKTVYTGAPFKSGLLSWDHVCIHGIIYWPTTRGASSIISFDLKSDKFGQVSIPERFVDTYGILVAKVHESLGLLERIEEGEMSVFGVWMRKDGVNKPFTKIYTVKVEGKKMLNILSGFRNNGDVVMEMVDDDFQESQIEVYEHSSGRINSVGISGECDLFSVGSYMETLLLLDQSNSIIH